MNILDFIPSQTVRNFARQSNYKLTSKDAACIVFASNKPLREKHEAYRAIIETMPNCKVGNKKQSIMLHELLSALMDWENKFIFKLKNAPNMLGGGNVLIKLDYKQSVYDDGKLYALYNKIHNHVYMSEREFIDIAKTFPLQFLDKPEAFSLNAQIANDDISCIYATYNCNWEIVDVTPSFANDAADKEYTDVVRAVAHIALSDKFPFPFKSGDLVCRKEMYIGDDKHLEYFDAQIEIIDAVEKDGKKRYNLYSYFGRLNCEEIAHKHLLRAEIVDKTQLPPKYFLHIAVSELLKNNITLAQFLRLYDYRNGKFECDQLTAKAKRVFRSVGIYVE